MDGQGWSDIAYNFLECPHGYTFEGRGINVINGANGTNSGNRSSHAICCLAGEGNPFSNAEKIGFRDCVHHISEKAPAPKTCKGHRDHKATACPGDVRYKWVHDGMPVPNVPVIPNPKLPESIVKKGDKMDSFLFRTTKSNAVWLVAGDLMEKRHVRNRDELKGFQELLEANGLSPDVCVLNSSEAISQAIAQIPAVGLVPDGYKGPRRR
jgi:hypothetical protein